MQAFIGEATAFACKSQECLWQDWYILCMCLIQIELGREMHALSCAGKPLAGWLARDAIQESREACGGHGYMKGMSCSTPDMQGPSTPSLPFVGQNCWTPTNFQFFCWDWTSLPNVGADFTSQIESCEPTNCLSGVL